MRILRILHPAVFLSNDPIPDDDEVEMMMTASCAM